MQSIQGPGAFSVKRPYLDRYEGLKLVKVPRAAISGPSECDQVGK